MTKQLPASTGVKSHPIAKAADKKQTQFIDILRTDHKFDLVQRIVEHMGEIKRAKKIKPQEKHRLLQNYYLTLLSYCLPKMKVVEDNTNKNAKPMNFTINIGGSKAEAKKKKAGMSITIPTKKHSDGSFSVNQSDPTD